MNVPYWIVFNKHDVPRPYLMDLVSCDYLQKFVLNILICLLLDRAVNTADQDHIRWTLFHVTFAEGLFYTFSVFS